MTEQATSRLTQLELVSASKDLSDRARLLSFVGRRAPVVFSSFVKRLNYKYLAKNQRFINSVMSAQSSNDCKF